MRAHTPTHKSHHAGRCPRSLLLHFSVLPPLSEAVTSTQRTEVYYCRAHRASPETMVWLHRMALCLLLIDLVDAHGGKFGQQKKNKKKNPLASEVRRPEQGVEGSQKS